MTYEKIRYDVAEGIATIRLNDPATLNAMSLRMGAELLDAIGRGEREGRAMLLTGAGRGFCSGANLTEDGIDLDDPAFDMGRQLETIYNPIVLAMRGSRVPVVTAVRGPAAGVGCGIALAGDLIVASDTALFFQAFAKVGLAPDGGSSYLLVNAIGRPRAMEMMLLGTKVPAATALEWGLVNRVVADAELDAAALGLARELANGPASLGIIKRVAWAAMDATIEGALAEERIAQREAGLTKDFGEGIAAFREKRAARFTGR